MEEPVINMNNLDDLYILYDCCILAQLIEFVLYTVNTHTVSLPLNLLRHIELKAWVPLGINEADLVTMDEADLVTMDNTDPKRIGKFPFWGTQDYTVNFYKKYGDPQIPNIYDTIMSEYKSKSKSGWSLFKSSPPAPPPTAPPPNLIGTVYEKVGNDYILKNPYHTNKYKKIPLESIHMELKFDGINVTTNSVISDGEPNFNTFGINLSLALKKSNNFKDSIAEFREELWGKITDYEIKPKLIFKRTKEFLYAVNPVNT